MAGTLSDQARRFALLECIAEHEACHDYKPEAWIGPPVSCLIVKTMPALCFGDLSALKVASPQS